MSAIGASSMSETRFRARYFGGEAPIGVGAEVWVTPAGLRVVLESETRSWPFEELRQPRVPRRGEPVHLERAGTHESLVFPDGAVLDAIRGAAPAGAARLRRPSGVPFPLAAAISVGAVVALVVATVLFGIPALAAFVAPTIPPEWEARFGEAMIDQVAPESQRMKRPEVSRGIERIVARLDRAGGGARCRVFVVDRDEVNALAAPGGNIVVFRGLIQFVESPEELAGVIAHEMAHVRLRHVIEGVLRRASLGVLISLAVGDASGPAAAGAQMAQALGELSYSRQAEGEADRVGLQALESAHIDPRPFADVLERFGTRGGAPAWAAFLSTHPAPTDRARALRETIARRGNTLTTTPLMEDGEWRAMRAAAKRPA
jgi:beta-barrel assembly-enhancing protease